MPCAKLQDRRARDLEHDERVPDASQRARPGQTDERREDHTGDRVRRADELQIGRRQAHALAVRDRAVLAVVADLNGRVGVVLSPPADGRYPVKVRAAGGDDESVRIKAANIERVE